MISDQWPANNILTAVPFLRWRIMRNCGQLSALIFSSVREQPLGPVYEKTILVDPNCFGCGDYAFYAIWSAYHESETYLHNTSPSAFLHITGAITYLRTS